jgi:hypothetical protein
MRRATKEEPSTAKKAAFGDPTADASRQPEVMFQSWLWYYFSRK